MENWICYNTNNKSIKKYKDKLLKKNPDGLHQHNVTRFMSLLMSIGSILFENTSYYTEVNYNDLYLDGIKIKKVNYKIKFEASKALEVSKDLNFEFLKVKNKLKHDKFSDLDYKDYGDVVKSTCFSFLKDINFKDKKIDALDKEIEEKIKYLVIGLVELQENKYINEVNNCVHIPIGNSLFRVTIKYNKEEF